jgi:hypothetical protein
LKFTTAILSFSVFRQTRFRRQILNDRELCNEDTRWSDHRPIFRDEEFHKCNCWSLVAQLSATGHNSKAVQRAYAKQALVKISSLEEYEKRGGSKP